MPDYTADLNVVVSVPLRGRVNESSKAEAAELIGVRFQSPCGEESMKAKEINVSTAQLRPVSVPLRGRVNESPSVETLAE